jgi:hypothetical protein
MLTSNHWRSVLVPFIFLSILLLSACTSMVPREKLPYPIATEDSAEQVKLVSIPLPVIAASPNEGVTYGGLGAFLFHNKRDEVTSLLAPQVNYNNNFGVSSSLYGSFYPTPDQYWEFNLSRSTHVNEDYELKYNDRFLDKKLELNSFLYYFVDGSSRFFGFQSSSSQHDETNYADQELGFTIAVGYPLRKHIQLVIGERVRDVDIRRGAVRKVPFIGDRFSADEVPGINGFTAHAQKVALVYSTMDSQVAPTYGGFAKLSVENSSKLLGSSEEYRHYELEMKGFIPMDKGKRHISVFRLVYNQTLGNNVPFLEQSILGGENTLRGYGRNRFIDNCYLLLNLEERIRLFRWEVFGVLADWEFAPFIDFGTVMDRLDHVTTDTFEFNPGIGMRAVVRPNIVGRIDVGFGKEGPAVFVGLGYPF